MAELIRAELDAAPAYLAVPTADRETVGLAGNEIPYGPLPGVPEAVARAMLGAHRYPDMAATELRGALAARYGVAPEQLVTGCGSVALAEALFRAACRPGDEIVYSWPTFEAYPILAVGAGATAVPVPAGAWYGHDLPTMAAAITGRTKVVVVCNPDNPNGTASSRAELDRFLDLVPPDVLVVLDEAYREFVVDDSVPDGLRVYAGRPNVVVLRTMSKAWGLAGLRIGFLVAQAEVAAVVRKVVTPYSTSLVAQAAALAALDAAGEVERRCALVVAERRRVAGELRALVPQVPESQANFVWLPLGASAAAFAEACAGRGVIVRPFAGAGVRVTIGTPAENDVFLGVAKEVVAAGMSGAAAGRP
jgi:histidinol-phosphate aminotransferase